MALTPTTHFEAWGQALYYFPPVAGTQYGENDFELLFAVADANHKWLAWYNFATGFAPDRVVLHHPHEVVAERSVRRSHFITQNPITSEELIGPIMASRGARRPPAAVKAAILWPKHTFGPDEIDISLRITGTVQGY